MTDITTVEVDMNHEETNTAVNALQMAENLKGDDSLTPYVDALTACRDAFGGFHAEIAQEDAVKLRNAMRYAANRGVYNRGERMTVLETATEAFN